MSSPRAQIPAIRMPTCHVSHPRFEKSRRWDRNNHNVNVNFAILNCLIAAAMGTQNAHAAHLSLRAVIAQRPDHRTLDVMDHSLFHQGNRSLLGRKRCGGKPQQIFDADFSRCFQCHQRGSFAVAQMMMIRNHHPIPQPALTQRRLFIRPRAYRRYPDNL